ncbi:MAG: 3-phosphoshikimate 1-carboxyvinyltransferase [Methanosphaera sp.]|uniref:3-phosphoshikimate 1-carboxyvinyltransferase n=1 Tax=Methanosphaera sp. TaxID=2666342 RepID=UPI0025F31BBA|nr:3-phosphoshikimate 1-carboxyvinyltransferase [Methanosphaera sp.]MCI5866563.1 3-phosphoshikimate 1-carboxyvinyltransferase [Methanosphaera sp.]MDD6535040.1 3-phosphoshikimate 1-carboxyvinyltransferase [Methanosphaera sp.]MDY3955472.1 3-phosphoshikimate 1-carboxyvinyltransferase [Methanosphaera sp.]
MDLEVKKVDQITGTIKAPASKSYSHRAFIAAALAEGESVLRDPLYSEDTLATLEACEKLGALFQRFPDKCIVQGTAGYIRTPDDIIDVKNSGTSIRILSSIAAIAPRANFTVFTGDESLRKRPMADLIDALENLGVMIYSAQNNGTPPIIVKGGFDGGETDIKGDVSSQFISSILMAAAYSKNPVTLNVRGKFVSKPYVKMTLSVMAKFGIQFEYDTSNEPEYSSYYIEPQKYECTDYTIEGDYSSASYIIAAAALMKSDITIKNLYKNSMQGDKLIVDIIKKMGATVDVNEMDIHIKSNGNLRAFDINLSNAPDLLPTVAILMAAADGTSKISGVEHARFKETDRVHNCAIELENVGVEVEEFQDGIIIKGNPTGGVVNSHLDHRMVMAFYVLGLKIGNITIKDAACYDISFPNFLEVMHKISQ